MCIRDSSEPVERQQELAFFYLSAVTANPSSHCENFCVGGMTGTQYVRRHKVVLGESQNVCKQFVVLSHQNPPVVVKESNERDQRRPFVPVVEGVVVDNGVKQGCSGHWDTRILSKSLERDVCGRNTAEPKRVTSRIPGGSIGSRSFLKSATIAQWIAFNSSSERNRTGSSLPMSSHRKAAWTALSFSFFGFLVA